MCQSLSQPGLFNDCVTNLFGGREGYEQKRAEADGEEVTIALLCETWRANMLFKQGKSEEACCVISF